jgi:hypothetical protein
MMLQPSADSTWNVEEPQYVGADGELVAVEVKGTAADAFISVELTDSEWMAAHQLRHQYRLFLVAGCLGTKPRLQELLDPATLVERREITAAPVRWRLVRR